MAAGTSWASNWTRGRSWPASAAGSTWCKPTWTAGLSAFAEGQFDFVVLSQTLQAVMDVQGVLKEILRIGRQGIISFPNIGYWKLRKHLFEEGRAPRAGSLLGYHWHNSPNVRFLSIADFEDFCRDNEHQDPPADCPRYRGRLPSLRQSEPQRRHGDRRHQPVTALFVVPPSGGIPPEGGTTNTADHEYMVLGRNYEHRRPRVHGARAELRTAATSCCSWASHRRRPCRHPVASVCRPVPARLFAFRIR